MRKTRKQVHADLLTAVQQMAAGNAARTTHVKPTEAFVARSKTGMTQADFAALMAVPLRSYQEWEQGRRTPPPAAKTLLRVASEHPEILRSLQTA